MTWTREDCDDGTADQLGDARVADLARARAFYQALGWREARQPDDEVCFFQAGGMIFGLWTALGGHGAPGIELAHNVRSPEDAGALLADAERAGGTIVARQHTLTGAEHKERSPTPTATCGKLPTTLTGPSTKTAQYTSDLRRRASGHQLATARHISAGKAKLRERSTEQTIHG